MHYNQNYFQLLKYDIAYLFNRGGIISVGSNNLTPHIIFDYEIISHQFNATPYFTKQLSNERIKTQDKVTELRNQGWGYKKIHRYLLKKGFKIGKSRTTMDSIIKKIKKQEEFLSQTIIDGFENIFKRFFKYYFKS